MTQSLPETLKTEMSADTKGNLFILTLFGKYIWGEFENDLDWNELDPYFKYVSLEV